jgi:hypothetical protein
MDWITNETRGDDEQQEERVIHLLKLVTNHNRSTHEQNMGIMDEYIVTPWIKNL